MSAGLESVGLADVRLLVKLMCLLAVGRIPKSCLTVSPTSAPTALMSDLVMSKYNIICLWCSKLLADSQFLSSALHDLSLLATTRSLLLDLATVYLKMFSLPQH